MKKIFLLILSILRWYMAVVCLAYCFVAEFSIGTVFLLIAAVFMLPLRVIYNLWEKVHLSNKYLKFGLLCFLVMAGMSIQSNRILADFQTEMEQTTLTSMTVTAAETAVSTTNTTAVQTTTQTVAPTTTTTVTETTTTVVPETETTKATETAATTTTQTTTTTASTTTTQTTTTTAVTTTKKAQTTQTEKTEADTKTQTKVTKTKPATEKTTTAAHEENHETMVWVTKSGKKYHSHNNCGTTDSKNARQIPLSEAQERYEPCSKCN